MSEKDKGAILSQVQRMDEIKSLLRRLSNEQRVGIILFLRLLRDIEDIEQLPPSSCAKVEEIK